MQHALRRLALPACAAALAPALGAQSFTILPAGYRTTHHCLSANGEWVVGADDQGGTFRWSEATGALSLGGSPNWASGVSNDGARVLATGDNGFGLDSAHIWTESNGQWNDLDTFFPNGTNCDSSLTSAYSFDDDGSVATGLAWEGCTAVAFRWDQDASPQMVRMPTDGPGSARGNTVSGDGRWIGGWDRNSFGSHRASIWDSDGTETFPLVSASNPEGFGEVWGFSTDGTRACGKGGFGGDPAWTWTQAGGVQTLGFLPGASPNDDHTAYAMSDDGSVVVGSSGNPFFGTTPRGWIWTSTQGMQNAAAVIQSFGFTVPSPIQAIWDVSADGRTMIGSLTSPFGFAGDVFVFTLPDPVEDLGGASAGTGGLLPSLSADGSFFPATPFTLALEDAAPNAISVFLVSIQDLPLPLFGGTIHTLPAAFTQVFSTDASGTWDTAANWPAGMVPGLALYFQTATFDPAAVGSWALSNALSATTP